MIRISFLATALLVVLGSLVPRAASAAEGEADASIRTLEGHTSSVMALTFSPDGKVLASGCRDSTIKLWSPQTGKYTRTLTGRVESLAFSPDGRTLATGGGGGDSAIKLWDLTKK